MLRPAAGFLLAVSALAQPAIRIDLLGTGGPELTPERMGAATLIRACGETLLFDAGRGVLQGIYRSGAPPQSVTKVFLTHLHNDHIEGLPPLWITPWFLLRRRQPLELWGPPGTREMVAGMRGMFAHDLARRANDVLKREYLDITVHEIAPGPVYAGGALSVAAVAVEHHDGNPAFAYRLEAGGQAILLTGDTTLTEPLRRAAIGARVVISNVAAGTAELERSGRIAPILDKLMKPEQAAELFGAAQPALAVFSHIVKKQLPGTKGDNAILDRTRRAGYRGRLLMGKDGTRIVVNGKVEVLSAPSLAQLPELDGAGILF